MTERQTIAPRTLRGIQQQLIVPPSTTSSTGFFESKGVVYTKRWVVDLLLDLAGYHSDTNLTSVVAVEPAAGQGAFLVAMIERLMESCQKFKLPIENCQRSLVAYELNDRSASRARDVVVSVLTENGLERPSAERLAAGWVRTGDYLLEATHIEADFIIGNPPYVRLEDIPLHIAALYRETFHTMYGRADLYVAFFEAALQQLKEGGVCAFICADRWMRNQYGAELRQLITSAYSVEAIIEMHNADAFHNEVDAYPAITIIRRKHQGPAVVASAGPETENLESSTISATLKAVARFEPLALPKGLSAAQAMPWFKGTDPWPCNGPAQLALLRRLEEQFPPLESSNKCTKVGIGVATGIDSVFITNDPNVVEPSRLVKLALAEDIRRGKMEWSGHYLVDPWNTEGLVDLNEYPKLREYFEKNSSLMRKRHTASKNPQNWYRTIDRVAHPLTNMHKLYIADIRSCLSPVLDEGHTYPHHNLYFIQSHEWNLEVLGGLLMSAVGQFFVESYGIRMRGGYLRFQAQYLRRIRVPEPGSLSTSESTELINAFRQGNRRLATQIALQLYRIHERELEIELE